VGLPVKGRKTKNFDLRMSAPALLRSVSGMAATQDADPFSGTVAGGTAVAIRVDN